MGSSCWMGVPLVIRGCGEAHLLEAKGWEVAVDNHHRPVVEGAVGKALDERLLGAEAVQQQAESAPAATDRQTDR
eukprot:133345-Prorocentrum_minimum.AAC.1